MDRSPKGGTLMGGDDDRIACLEERVAALTADVAECLEMTRELRALVEEHGPTEPHRAVTIRARARSRLAPTQPARDASRLQRRGRRRLGCVAVTGVLASGLLLTACRPGRIDAADHAAAYDLTVSGGPPAR